MKEKSRSSRAKAAVRRKEGPWQGVPAFLYCDRPIFNSAFHRRFVDGAFRSSTVDAAYVAAHASDPGGPKVFLAIDRSCGRRDLDAACCASALKGSGGGAAAIAAVVAQCWGGGGHGGDRGGGAPERRAAVPNGAAGGGGGSGGGGDGTGDGGGPATKVAPAGFFDY